MRILRRFFGLLRCGFRLRGCPWVETALYGTKARLRWCPVCKRVQWLD